MERVGGRSRLRVEPTGETEKKIKKFTGRAKEEMTCLVVRGVVTPEGNSARHKKLFSTYRRQLGHKKKMKTKREKSLPYNQHFDPNTIKCHVAVKNNCKFQLCGWKSCGVRPVSIHHCASTHCLGLTDHLLRMYLSCLLELRFLA